MPTDSNSQLSIHAKAVNLARRLTAQNEADLLQEPFYDEDADNKKFTHDTCQQMSQHLIHLKSLPHECLQYSDVVVDLKRRDTDTTHPTQFLS
mmetsp:Transcript_14883/g.19541  ORF Transcript_14883/g.19541 Transcript_14883/m.19541 type:complete len:93 (+) Transcript_14883:136-414(+)|eukprot:CAMPEP_0195283656 /NCGR_PEP_ID=MMETSP0707-20130614/2129_1 /TAXON_ID=33640 /ORGANISM="Asterionellopsis glacialis, Strain CCMP134" /LENGTH=92 /DNA_ID=CAMNT_0040342863 /DNA_START=96 /DNA_END=374 /DNA_ORIENTATION=-